MPERTKSYFFLMALMTLFFSLVCFEVTARFFEEMDHYATTKEFDPVIGWHLKTGNYEIRPAGRIQKVPIEINRFHVRNKDFDPRLSENQNRVIVLGDSFVFARHFPLQETFTGRLEEILNRQSPFPVRVINAGVPGYGTGQEWLLMKRLADEDGLNAKVYLLSIFPNDILDNLRLSYGEQEVVDVKPGFKLDASGRAVVDRLPSDNLSGLKESFRRPEKNNFWKLRSYYFIRQAVVGFFQSHPEYVRFLMKTGFKVSLPRKPGLLNGWYDDSVVAEGLPLMKALIAEIKAEADKQGAVLKVFMIPSPVQVYPDLYKKILMGQFPNAPEVKRWVDDPFKAQRLVGEICRDLGLDYFDLYPVLKAHEAEHLYLPRDGHFDRDAHKITAETLAQWLQKGNAK